ncbi:MAG: DUF4360 domain-containing protein [Bdellovibrionales bacterium]|jgi:hypothetical protein|nr:DUF4360 domain-containing protein [Bdellovibrionales bacterium]
MKPLTFIFAFLMATSTIKADTNFRFKDINLLGKGCPDGTFSVVKSPDDQTVSIIFDQFSVEVPQENKLIDSKSCDIHISSILKNNERVTSIDIDVDYRGFVSIEGNAIAKLQTYLLSWSGPQKGKLKRKNLAIDKNWSKGAMDDWYLKKTVSVPINSNCSRHGDDQASFRLKNILLASIPSRSFTADSNALLTFDSSDLKGVFKLKLHTKTCGNSGNINRGHNRRPSPRYSRRNNSNSRYRGFRRYRGRY